MLVTFDPRTDDEDPTITSISVNRTDYSVCTAFGDTTINIPTEGQQTILSCLTTGDASVIVVDYDVSDVGGAGLDYIEIGVTNQSGGTILNKTHKLRGAQKNGRFFTPQIIHSQKGEPGSVDIRVFDRNANRANTTASS